MNDNCQKLSLLARIMKKKEANLDLLSAKRGFDEEKILEIKVEFTQKKSNFDANSYLIKKLLMSMLTRYIYLQILLSPLHRFGFKRITLKKHYYYI